MSEQQEIYNQVEKAFGFVPNMIKTLATNPVVAKLYLQGNQILGEGVLTPQERQVVMLAISNYNDCGYCMAAHGKATTGNGLAQEDAEAIRAGGLPKDSRLSALVSGAKLIVSKRGKLTPDDLASLKSAGVDKAQLHEIVALAALKTITNYIDHFEEIELDPQFA
ncbi:carboxymuconolactone decarboxylase family protein [Oligoflexia bacterium]|nr:carboxymuconolactone decarboxylase family protein [Oligoflexia bacterium]